MKNFNTVGPEEATAALEVCNRGLLSGYIGSDPYGGPAVTELERDWKTTFKVKHAIAVNSATSGLLAACMAAGVGPEDEVIVSPYTMSASAAAPHVLGAKLVWADIEPENYTIDPVEVSNKITRKTKAVIATNLFGHPAHLRELRDVCDADGVYLIEDNAQAIFSQENGVYTGTIGHIGVFSLNVHKCLQVGEGGVCTTNSSDLDVKLRAAMNHGEMRGSIVGLNLRMTEVTAAMALAQLKKANGIVESRQDLWHELTLGAAEMRLPISVPHWRSGTVINPYVWGAQLRRATSVVIKPPFRRGYLRPLYEIKAFRSPDYLPVVEEVERKMLLVELCAIDPTIQEITTMLTELRVAL